MFDRLKERANSITW